MKIASTYDEERAYTIYSIVKWREATSLAFELPRHRFTKKTKFLAMKIEEEVFFNKLPEEETCKNFIKNCLHNRDQLIYQLQKQYT